MVFKVPAKRLIKRQWHKCNCWTKKNSKSWDKAVRDGFVPGETLFEIEEALQRGTIFCYLLSDAAQIALWPTVQKYLTAGKALYFSHGFGITFNEQTGIIPPKDVDVF